VLEMQMEIGLQPRYAFTV